ncbi:MAG: S-layer homology domain-containing protein [Candidatus Riflebacteria bacterium]|nr:S-layer homology domain-containing protein [Candidatus Riflebacteria bacterium]
MNIKSIIASSAMILAASAISFADPFSDVPTSHWAYEAVNSMAEKGIIQGFPDGTFKGNSNVTRYQMAMMTAQALANMGEKRANVAGNDLNNLEKLTVEFADELALLGVKVTSLEDDMQVLKDDVSGLKKDMDYIKSNYGKNGINKVKLSGDFLIRNYGAEIKDVASFHRTGSQLRLQMDAQIDENVKAIARWRMIDDNNNDFGAAGMPGAAWNGSNHATADVDVAYIEIKDMFRFHGDFVFGRRFMTHGHGLVANKFHDAVSYLKRCGDVDLAVNAYFNRHGDNDTHNMWNINADTKYRGHDIYMGLYYQTFNKDYLNSINAGEPPFEKNMKTYIIELGAKGDLGDNGYWSYDIGGVYKYRTEFKPNAANTGREKGKGFILHGAINWDSKEEWAAKVAYTGVDYDASMSSNVVSFDERYVDSYENPLEDIMRDSRYTLGVINPVVANIEDLKVQFEYTPKNNNKHYFRVAYDLVKPKDDNKLNTFFVVGNGNSDSCDVLNVEYRYRLAENTRFRIGYTDYNYGSGDFKFDSSIFWTEIFSRF